MAHSVLFINCGTICYDSTIYFENKIGKCLKNLGWHTEHLSVDKNNPAEGLKPYYGKNYDLIFDINTIVPSAVDEDGKYCLDEIGGQVWHYVIDHPFYHHDALAAELSDFHAVCIDKNHEGFVREHYPHMKNVITLPIAAEKAEELIPYGDRKYDLAFTGTYTDPESIFAQAKRGEDDLFALFQGVVELLLKNPDMTQEEATDKILPGHWDKLPGIMQLNYLADCYIQAYVREELIKKCVGNNLPITVFGHGWERLWEKLGRTWKLKLGGEVTYDRLPEIYAGTKIALNQTPWFKAGMHDRVPLALQNGSLCVTEKCPYVEEMLGDCACYYPVENLDVAVDIIEEMLADGRRAAEISALGCSFAREHFGWEQWTGNFLGYAKV
ncbi:MAG: hypothetical protein LUI02_05895 [Clostridiales bacterium]|nr:hypothetical protein [Clostridiales bacterium]